MEAVAVKQGCLYLQQHQAFAKKWRRFGAVLYAESGCALARLELQEGPEKTRRGDAGRRVIRLSDCLRVAEAGSEASSPRDTSAFLLETKERLYLLAAPTAERSDWLQAICLLAFPRKELQAPEGKSGQPHMEINELYSRATVVPCKEFAVTMRPTEASERCRLRGSYILRAGENALELWGGSEPGTPLFHWPYRFLRRFGRDKVTFSFEAGRRCLSGEGSFEFETRQGNEIFSALEEAISAQKNAGPAPAAARPESPYAQRRRVCEARAVVLRRSSFPSSAGGGGRSGAGSAPPSSLRQPAPALSRCAVSQTRTVPVPIWLVDSRRFSLSRKMPRSKLDKRRNKDMTKRLLPKLP